MISPDVISHGTTDRAIGALLGTACGDALGVPYEFAERLPQDREPEMVGGGLGPYAPGEYSDDTQMAVCVAEALRDHDDPCSPEALEQTARAFSSWMREGASDIGVQTARVLRATEKDLAEGVGAAEAMTRRSDEMYASGERCAGNGSLMRTAPLALAHLHDPIGLADSASRYSHLTHGDPLAAQACVLWCEAVRHAIVHGTYDGVRAGLDLLESKARLDWDRWLTEAEQNPPETFAPNGFVVPALQAAWSSIVHNPVGESSPERYTAPVMAAVRVGDDTDTVAAIAGALVGARWGSGAIPAPYLEMVHGWPGYRAEGLGALARAILERHTG